MTIHDYPNYKVTKEGKVWSTKNNIFLKPGISNRGYEFVILYNGSKQKRIARVHRLVAECYLPNPDKLPQVNHKDLNRMNNRVDNLEWCTAMENIRHAIINGKRRGKSLIDKKRELQEAGIPDERIKYSIGI